MSATLPSASLAAAAVHLQPRWTLPQALPLLPTTTMPSALSTLRPRPRTKTRTLARQWHSKAHALAHLWMVPVNLPQPPYCCHRAANVALCAAAELRTAATAADAAAAAAPPPSFWQSCAVRCCHCRSIRAAATMLLPLRCAPPPHFALPPPTLTLPPPPCHRQASANVALRCIFSG